MVWRDKPLNLIFSSSEASELEAVHLARRVKLHRNVFIYKSYGFFQHNMPTHSKYLHTKQIRNQKHEVLNNNRCQTEFLKDQRD